MASPSRVRELSKTLSIEELVKRFRNTSLSDGERDDCLFAIETQGYQVEDFIEQDLIRSFVQANLQGGHVEWPWIFIQSTGSDLAISLVKWAIENLDVNSDAAYLFAQVPFAFHWDAGTLSDVHRSIQFRQIERLMHL